MTARGRGRGRGRGSGAAATAAAAAPTAGRASPGVTAAAAASPSPAPVAGGAVQTAANAESTRASSTVSDAAAPTNSSPAPRPPPLVRAASSAGITNAAAAAAASSPLLANPATSAAAAAPGTPEYAASVQTPGHPQYEQYMAALNYYMAQFATNAGQAASAGSSPASTPNNTPPGTPRLGGGAIGQGSVARPFVPGHPTTGAASQPGAPGQSRMPSATPRPPSSMSVRPQYTSATATLNQQSSYSSPYAPMSTRTPSNPMPSRYDPRGDLRDPANLPVLSKDRLRYIVAQIDPTFKLENDVEEMMLEIADDFITRVATKACKLAKHRKSIRVAVRDARIPLEQDWSIRVPGFGAEPPEREDNGDAPASTAAGASEADPAAAPRPPDSSETEKTRLHRLRMQKVREAIRDGGRHRYAVSASGPSGGVGGGGTAAGQASSLMSAGAGLPGATSGGVKKIAKQRAPPKSKAS